MPPFSKIVPPGRGVTVRIIDSTTHIAKLPANVLMKPEMPGMENMPPLPTWSFLIEHDSGRQVLFDLGVPVDWQDLAPAVSDRLKSNGWEISVQKSTTEILKEDNVDTDGIEAIVWSHFHWDHIGNPNHFPPSTTLIVGPGFTSDPDLFPGYPTNPKSKLRETDWANRKLRQINFSKDEPGTTQIGPFQAHDYFGDGSFYLLDTPGHATGHLAGLARTTSSTDANTNSSRDTFIFMGGDLTHHSGELRPSHLLPLPSSDSTSTIAAALPQSCPGHLLEALQTSRQRIPTSTTPFFDPNMGSDMEAVKETISKTQIADADENVLYIFAHDTKVRDVVDLFPKTANNWFERGWRRELLWKFVEDFERALKKGGDGKADGKL